MSQKCDKITDDLIKILESYQKNLRLDDKRTDRLNLMVKQAKDLVYHDFESNIAFPKVQLIIDAEFCNLPKVFINKVKDGDYDN